MLPKQVEEIRPTAPNSEIVFCEHEWCKYNITLTPDVLPDALNQHMKTCQDNFLVRNELDH